MYYTEEEKKEAILEVIPLYNAPKAITPEEVVEATGISLAEVSRILEILYENEDAISKRHQDDKFLGYVITPSIG